ncbi:MAG: hypothetical protein ACYDGR_02015 [Candidatus Dormibacteria bacterium]
MSPRVVLAVGFAITALTACAGSTPSAGTGPSAPPSDSASGRAMVARAVSVLKALHSVRVSYTYERRSSPVLSPVPGSQVSGARGSGTWIQGGDFDRVEVSQSAATVRMLVKGDHGYTQVQGGWLAHKLNRKPTFDRRDPLSYVTLVDRPDLVEDLGPGTTDGVRARHLRLTRSAGERSTFAGKVRHTTEVDDLWLRDKDGYPVLIHAVLSQLEDAATMRHQLCQGGAGSAPICKTTALPSDQDLTDTFTWDLHISNFDADPDVVVPPEALQGLVQ